MHLGPGRQDIGCRVTFRIATRGTLILPPDQTLSTVGWSMNPSP